MTPFFLQGKDGIGDSVASRGLEDVYKRHVKKYIPVMAAAHYHGHSSNEGDAIRWGEALGASLADMGAFQGHGAVCTPHNIHLGWPVITEGGIQVNRSGLRFSNENEGYS